MGFKRIERLKCMKTGELKILLKDVPDDLEVVCSGSDHSFIRVGRGCDVRKAELFERSNHLSEYYGQENKSDPKNPVVKVFWIDDGRY